VQCKGIAFDEGRSYASPEMMKRLISWDSLTRIAIAIAIFNAALVIAIPCLAEEDLGQDVECWLVALSAKRSRLTWNPADGIVGCSWSVTYSIFRGTSEDFTPSLKNRIASGLTQTTYVTTEPVAGKDYYYNVKAVVTPTACVPYTGTIMVFPLDLRQQFDVAVGSDSGSCTATSTSEITCSGPLPNFHAAIAEQAGHEYLIGCRSGDYEAGSWTCANLTPGVYHVGVHSQTLTVWDSGLSEINLKTGKAIARITPVFSVLARMR
jgi:hypothetical protein